VLKAARSSSTGSAETGVFLERVGAAGFSLGSGLDVTESGSDDVDVEDLGTSSSGEHEPDDGKGLEDKVHGDPVEDRSDSEGFSEVQEAEYDPVSEPLLVVVLTRRLDSLDREVSGESPTDQVGYGGGEAKHVEEDQDDGRDGKTEDTVCLGNLRSGFNVTEDRVFVKLSIQRVHLASDDLVGLLDIRVVEEVLLDLLRLGGHLVD